MFDSPVVDVALGLILFFLILSLICSAVQEWIASAVGLRSRNLRKGIENLIGADIAKSLYDHGQFKSLYREAGKLGFLKNARGKRGVGPSYVEPKRFANILIDRVNAACIGGHDRIKILPAFTADVAPFRCDERCGFYIFRE